MVLKTFNVGIAQNTVGVLAGFTRITAILNAHLAREKRVAFILFFDNWKVFPTTFTVDLPEGIYALEQDTWVNIEATVRGTRLQLLVNGKVLVGELRVQNFFTIKSPVIDQSFNESNFEGQSAQSMETSLVELQEPTFQQVDVLLTQQKTEFENTGEIVTQTFPEQQSQPPAQGGNVVSLIFLASVLGGI